MVAMPWSQALRRRFDQDGGLRLRLRLITCLSERLGGGKTLAVVTTGLLVRRCYWPMEKRWLMRVIMLILLHPR